MQDALSHIGLKGRWNSRGTANSHDYMAAIIDFDLLCLYIPYTDLIAGFTLISYIFNRLHRFAKTAAIKLMGSPAAIVVIFLSWNQEFFKEVEMIKPIMLL